MKKNNRGLAFPTFYGLRDDGYGHFCAKYKHPNTQPMEGSSTNGAASAASGEGGGTQAVQNDSATENNKKMEEKDIEQLEQGQEGQVPAEKTQRDLFYERHRRDYPDDDEADEDLVYRRINERNSEYDRLKKNDDDFRTVVNEHPQFGGMFLDAADGKDFFDSLFSRFSKEDIMSAYDDPEKAKELSEKYEAYMKSEQDAKKFREEGDANIKETIERFRKYCEDNNIGEDEAMEMWQKINDFYAEGLSGKFSDELFDMMRKASTHDTDVEAARQEGELAGHNAKVQATLAKGKAPAGIPPTFSGGQGATLAEPKPKNKKVVRNPFTNEDMEFDE